MDADIPSIGLITPTGAVRSTGQTTITTQSDHNLQVGDTVQIANVDDPSFNQSAQVASTPSSTTFTYAQLALPDAFSGDGTVELIIQGDVYRDTVLLPMVAKAYRKVQARLLMAGSKTATGEVTLTLTVGQQSLDDASTPQLPVDFLAPKELQERITGTQFFTPMCEVDTLPNLPQQAYNSVFTWQNETLTFLGSLNSMDLDLRYYKGVLNDIIDASSQILIRGGLDAVVDWATYLAANSRGLANAQTFAAMFDEDMGELKNLQAHAMQYKQGVGRRLPYNRRSRGSRLGFVGW